MIQSSSASRGASSFTSSAIAWAPFSTEIPSSPARCKVLSSSVRERASSSATSIFMTLPPPVFLPLPAQFLPTLSQASPAVPSNRSPGFLGRPFQAPPPFPRPRPSKDFSACPSSCVQLGRAVHSHCSRLPRGISADSPAGPAGISPATHAEFRDRRRAAPSILPGPTWFSARHPPPMTCRASTSSHHAHLDFPTQPFKPNFDPRGEASQHNQCTAPAILLVQAPDFSCGLTDLRGWNFLRAQVSFRTEHFVTLRFTSAHFLPQLPNRISTFKMQNSLPANSATPSKTPPPSAHASLMRPPAGLESTNLEAHLDVW